MTFQLLTPCCGAPILPEFEYRGREQGDSLVGFSCAGPTCWNEWDRAGNQTHATFEPEPELTDNVVGA